MAESPTSARPKPRVRLCEIVEAMDMQFDEVTTWLHRPTGKLVVVTDDALRATEDGDDPGELDWILPEEREAAQALVEGSDDYIALPDGLEINEYRMMERFALNVDDADASRELERAIQGKGAFRYFKDTVHRLGLRDAWHAHRDREYEEVARAWCEDNGIELDDSPIEENT